GRPVLRVPARLPPVRPRPPDHPFTRAMNRSSTSLAMNLLERDLVPDLLIRPRIRTLLRARLGEAGEGGPERQQQRLQDFVRTLAASPVAIETAAANEQHYEVPTEFYTRVLGKHLKYSSGYYPDPGAAPADNLDAAEARMLALTCQ